MTVASTKCHPRGKFRFARPREVLPRAFHFQRFACDPSQRSLPSRKFAHVEAAQPVAIRRPWGFERFIKQQGFHGIYLVTTERGAPVKVGITEDPVNRFNQLQAANFVLLRFHRFWWLPGRLVSKKIESEFKSHFEPQNIRGEWFDTP